MDAFVVLHVVVLDPRHSAPRTTTRARTTPRQGRPPRHFFWFITEFRGERMKADKSGGRLLAPAFGVRPVSPALWLRGTGSRRARLNVSRRRESGASSTQPSPKRAVLNFCARCPLMDVLSLVAGGPATSDRAACDSATLEPHTAACTKPPPAAPGSLRSEPLARDGHRYVGPKSRRASPSKCWPEAP